MAPAIIIQCGYSQSSSKWSILAIAPSLVISPSPSAPALRALTGRLSESPFCKLPRAIYSSTARSLQAISKIWRTLAGDGLPHKTSEPVLVFASSKLGLVAAGISLVIIGAVNGIGGSLSTKFNAINTSLK